MRPTIDEEEMKVGRKRHGFYKDEQAVHDVIVLKRRARKAVVDRQGNPKPTPYATIARELNAEGYRTQTGKLWYGQIVTSILGRRQASLDRLEQLGKEPKRRQKKQLETSDFLTAREIEICRKVYKGREIVLFETLLRTGLRAAELCALQVRDLGIYRGKRQIDVREGKGCKSRTIFVGPQICEILNYHLRIRAEKFGDTYEPKSSVFFNNQQRPIKYWTLYYRIKAIARSSGLLSLHPHSLRHTFLATLYNQDYDLKYVQEQAGHASIATTEIYAKTFSNKKLAAMERLDGLFAPSRKPAQSQ